MITRNICSRSTIAHTQILLTLNNDTSHTTIALDQLLLTVNNRTYSSIVHTQLLLTIHNYCSHTHSSNYCSKSTFAHTQQTIVAIAETQCYPLVLLVTSYPHNSRIPLYWHLDVTIYHHNEIMHRCYTCLMAVALHRELLNSNPWLGSSCVLHKPPWMIWTLSPVLLLVFTFTHCQW